jgi:hypothetical protein
LRNVLIHYHIFKNAGSSLDAILEASLGPRWISWDPEGPGAVQPPRSLAAFIRANPAALAASSHNIRPPFPVMLGVNIWPVFFVRHPILRVASIYKYERSAKLSTMSGQVAAENSFADYIRWFFSGRPEVVTASIANFQTIYLSGEQHRYEEPGVVSANARVFERSLAVLEDVAVFGIVERFEESIDRFEQKFNGIFPELQWHPRRENTTGSSLSTLAEIREKLGDELYLRLEQENEFDLELYRRAHILFDNAAPLAL